MICSSELCEFNGVCIDTDNVTCYHEQYIPTSVGDIETFSSEPFNEFGWCFKYHNGFFYNTGTGERYYLRRKGKCFEITPEFLKHVYNSYHRTSIKDNIVDSKIEHVLNDYIIELIKEKVI